MFMLLVQYIAGKMKPQSLSDVWVVASGRLTSVSTLPLSAAPQLFLPTGFFSEISTCLA
jgi:hypothetical protein